MSDNYKIMKVLEWFVKLSRQYRDYQIGWYVIQKVYNRGMGCRDMLRVNPFDKTIHYVEDMVSKADMKRIVDLGLCLGAKTEFGWKLVPHKVSAPSFDIIFS